VVALERPTSGHVRYESTDITALRGRTLRRRRRDLQMMFQDPYSSLDPRMRVGSIIREPLVVQGIGTHDEQQQRVSELLSEVGLSARSAELYPHEFSGGQRQRIGLARALALNPKLVIADEPVSALDVSIQAQVINLLEDLQAKLGLTYLFIAHDLSVVRHISTRVAVMYVGKLMEMAPRDALYEEPLHPYTISLLSAIPIPDPHVEQRRKRIVLTGDIPSPVNPPSGCRFHTRCPIAFERCKTDVPAFNEYRPGHFAACHWVEEHDGKQPDITAAIAAKSSPSGAVVVAPGSLTDSVPPV
jgi:oligopeptide transport system ATP-binding protein